MLFSESQLVFEQNLFFHYLLFKFLIKLSDDFLLFKLEILSVLGLEIEVGLLQLADLIPQLTVLRFQSLVCLSDLI